VVRGQLRLPRRYIPFKERQDLLSANQQNSIGSAQKIAPSWQRHPRCHTEATPRRDWLRWPRTKSSRKWFAKVLEEAEIKDLTWHDFRHTFGSRLRAARVQIEDIRYLLGHGAKAITFHYAHANLDVLREAVATLDRKPEKSTGTKTGTPSVLRFRAS
jgi:integrase